MDKDKLKKYNQVVLNTYDTFLYKDAVDCVMPGHFGGNDILFIAQNPGQLKGDVVADMKYFQAYRDRDLEQMEEYYVEALRSEKGTYGTFITDVYSADWSNISFTNVFKCPFLNNEIPTEITRQELAILEFQISLVKPKLIVAVGSVAFKALEALKLTDKYAFVKCYHPAYLKKQSGKKGFPTYEEYVKIYKEEIKKTS